MASRFWIATDTDGNCSRCGILWSEEELNGSLRHECPPGFWKYSKRPNKPVPTITAKQAVSEIADILTGKRTVREVNEGKMRLSERYIYKKALEAILNLAPSDHDVVAAMHIARESLDLGKNGNVTSLPEWGHDEQ